MMENEGTLNKAVKGGKWVAFASLTNKLLGAVSFFVLARFLEPASYGLIAIAMMVAGVFNQMIVTGFEVAVTQRQDDIEPYLGPIMAFNLLKSLCIFGVVFLFAPQIAHFFHADNTVYMIQLSGIFVILPALSNNRQLHILRNFEFNKMYYRDTIAQVSYIVVGALWVFLVRADVWALFWANVARYLTSSLVVAWYYPRYPKLSLKFGKLKELIPYSKWVVGQNIVDYVGSLIDSVFIGRLMNPYTLGLYTKGRNLAAVAYAPIGGINKSLSFVAFSKLQDETPKLQEGFFMTIDLILFFGLANVFIFWLAGPEIIQFFLGPQWVSVVPALKIFTIATLLSSFFGTAYALFDGAGKPMVTFKAKTMNLLFYAVFSYLGIHWKSMAGAAAGITFSNLLICAYAAYKLKKIYFIEFGSSLKRFLLVGAPFMPAAGIFYVVQRLVGLTKPVPIIGLLIATYGVFGFFFWLLGRRYERGCFHTIMVALKILFKGKREGVAV